MQGVKDPLDRIRELEDHCEALENALEKIKAVTFEPKQTLPAREAADCEDPVGGEGSQEKARRGGLKVARATW